MSLRETYGSVEEDYRCLRSRGYVDLLMLFGPEQDIEDGYWWWEEMEKLASRDGMAVKRVVSPCGAGSYYLLGLEKVVPDVPDDWD